MIRELALGTFLAIALAPANASASCPSYSVTNPSDMKIGQSYDDGNLMVRVIGVKTFAASTDPLVPSWAKLLLAQVVIGNDTKAPVTVTVDSFWAEDQQGEKFNGQYYDIGRGEWDGEHIRPHTMRQGIIPIAIPKDMDLSKMVLVFAMDALSDDSSVGYFYSDKYAVYDLAPSKQV